jgi:plasmid stability protein
MGSILVRGLDEKTIARLKERARLNGRSLQQEVKAILERAADTLTMSEARRCPIGGSAASADDRSPTVHDSSARIERPDSCCPAPGWSVPDGGALG